MKSLIHVKHIGFLFVAGHFLIPRTSPLDLSFLKIFKVVGKNGSSQQTGQIGFEKAMIL
jgi:hypothetical protein